MSFCRETSEGIAKCWLFSEAILEGMERGTLPLLQIITSLKKQVFIGFHFRGFDFSEENLVKKKIMEILILAGVDHFP